MRVEEGGGKAEGANIGAYFGKGLVGCEYKLVTYGQKLSGVI